MQAQVLKKKKGWQTLPIRTPTHILENSSTFASTPLPAAVKPKGLSQQTSWLQGFFHLNIYFPGTQLKIPGRLGKMVHTCNPSYLGGRDWEDHSFV
jgi:hypothetical protein